MACHHGFVVIGLVTVVVLGVNPDTVVIVGEVEVVAGAVVVVVADVPALVVVGVVVDVVVLVLAVGELITVLGSDVDGVELVTVVAGELLVVDELLVGVVEVVFVVTGVPVVALWVETLPELAELVAGTLNEGVIEVSVELVVVGLLLVISESVVTVVGTAETIVDFFIIS